MHIPDTAISPITSAVAIAAMAPVWNAASRRLRKDLDSKQVPLLAISAAFCFTIMMFNIPVPGGTTVHPVGGVLMAILLGPWAAVIGVTTALIIQSLFFGDGGVLAIGANCFTMAFAMPFAGYLSYRLICGKSPSPGRTSFAAGAGAYIGLNVAALLTAVILGIQPSIAHEATGQALYFPFGLHVTVPAIMAAHLLVAGFAEAITTGLIVRYALSAGILQSHRLALATKKSGKLWIALAGLAALTPLGLLAKGDAWGEWGVDAITKQAGYTPKGLASVSDHAWKGFNLLPDYGSDGGAKSYILASIVGIATISALLAVIFIPILRRRKVNSNLPVAAKSDLQPGSVPAWMMQDDLAAATQQNCSRFAPKPDFAEKTVESLAKAAHRALVTEPSAKVDGFLQSIDSRIKLVATLLLVLAITFTRHLIAPTIILVACCALAFSSRIDLRTLFARVVPFALFFGSVIAVPAMLDVVTPGPKILHIWFTSMYITSTGLITALTLIIRLMAALCAVQLFTLSTPRQEIFRSIRSIGIPTAFTMTLEMTYRYLEVFARTATEGFTARKSRLTGADSLGQSHVFLGDLGGALFGKSLNFATEVHSAMVSRGWDGSVVIANPRTIGRRDIVLIFGGLALCTAILVVDRYFH